MLFLIKLLLVLIPLTLVGLYTISRLVGKSRLENLPVIPLLIVSFCIGLEITALTYYYSISLFHSYLPFAFLLLLALYLLKKDIAFVSIRFCNQNFASSFFFFAITALIIFFIHLKIGIGHVESHMVIADAIKYGNLPVMNTAELGTIGIDKLELDNETSLFTIHESIYFPLNFFPLEEPLRPFHYKHPSILSVFRLLSLDMAYPLLQLFELVIFKLSIISMIFLFINYETGKALLGFAGASIYIFSGSWLMLSNLSEWLFIMNNVSPTEYSSSYRLAFGNAISFGYPTTLIQNPDIIIDFMTGTFFLFGFFYFLKKETSTLTLLAPILLMVFFMKNGTGFGYISSALILSLMLTYHKLIKENTSQYKLVFLTGILLLAVSSITFKWTLDFYNVYFTDNLKLLQKETLYFVKWESETFPLGQIGSWIKLFLQTGNILIFMPLVIFLAKDRSVSFLNHSLFIGGIFLADITVGFLFLGFNWPDWNMTRFWTFSFHYWNIAIAISWSIWIMKTRFNRAVKIIVSAPLAVSIIIQFIFIFGLTKYASYIHLVNAF